MGDQINMRKHFRKMLTVLLTSALLLSLTACLDSDFLSDSEGSENSYSDEKTDGESKDDDDNDESAVSWDDADSNDESAESWDEPDSNDESGKKISFETTDLDGNTVKSEDIFGEYRVTMINIWGTFCGPCIGEMPELEKLSKSISEKNCGVIGVVCDIYGANDSYTINSAKDIINSTGVTYMNVIPWKGIDDKLPSKYVPTTYFVDSKGNVVGNVMVGANYAIDYEKEIDNILDKMD